MTLMDAYRLTLRERVRAAKIDAICNPTHDRIVSYGKTIMAYWAVEPERAAHGATVAQSVRFDAERQHMLLVDRK